MTKSFADWPLRVVTGAFIANSGVTKLSADAETAKGLHGFAAGTYPFLAEVPPEKFTKALGAGETALGVALLIPGIPSRLVGAGLTAFAGGLLGLYLRTPGQREEGSLRPTSDGIALAKDSWLLGAGLSLIGFDRYRRRRRGA